MLLAGLATPLVVSVHTVVSFDFTVAICAGWHSTIFPPYFVAGAIYSGFAMVLTLAIPLRKFYNLEDFITMRHLDNHGQGDARHRPDRRLRLHDGNLHGLLQRQSVRPLHDHQPHDWPLRRSFTGADRLQHRDSAGLVVAQGSRERGVLFVISLIVNMGMWLERFVIVVISLHRDFCLLPGACSIPTRWDWATFVGTFGLFLTLLLSVHPLPADDFDFEMRSLVQETSEEKPQVIGASARRSMAQIFHHSTNTVSRLSIYGAAVYRGVLGAVLYRMRIVAVLYATRMSREQPVPFSHRHHAGELGIDCRYCHTSVEKSSFAGVPPTQTCMTCHSQIWTNARCSSPCAPAIATTSPSPGRA